jgi:hypothetical protein
MRHYAIEAETGKHRLYPVQRADQSKMPSDGTDDKLITYRASDGRRWGYKRKRGRTLAMLATWADGVTQWDCYPWHTRLAATIKVMRDDGIEIETTLEGPFRHARYHLRTPGSLIIQGENRDGGSFPQQAKSA